MQCTNTKKYYPDGTFITTLPPCGKCLSCRLNDRHIWASRLVMERKCHTDAQFITLTYSDDYLPDSQSELNQSFTAFIKRYRKNLGHQPRFFAALEYGTRFGRPHWHAIFFGSKTHYERRRGAGGSKSIIVDPNIEDNWQNGSTYVKDCSYSGQGMNITQYVAGYILKNRWQQSDSSELPTKSEWARQSTRP